MRKILLPLVLISSLLAACSGSIKPRVGAEWASPNGQSAFAGLGLGEAEWGSPDIGTTNVRVDLTPLWWILGALVVVVGGVVAVRLLKRKS